MCIPVLSRLPSAVVVATLVLLCCAGQALGTDHTSDIVDAGGCPVWSDTDPIVYTPWQDRVVGDNFTSYKDGVDVSIKNATGDALATAHPGPGGDYWMTIPWGAAWLCVKKTSGGGRCDEQCYGMTPPGQGIPTVSEWGLIVMTLLLLTAGTVVLGRRRRAAAAAD